MKRLLAALLLLAVPVSAADKKISALSNGSPVVATDKIVIARGAGNFYLPFSSVWAIPSGSQVVLPTGCTTPGVSFNGSLNDGLCIGAAGSVGIANSGTEYWRFTSGNAALMTISAMQFAWTNGTITGTLDTGLKRAAAGVVKVTNGGAGYGSFEFNTNLQVGSASTNSLDFTIAAAKWFRMNDAAIRAKSTAQFSWSSGDPSASAEDTGLARAAAGVVKVTNGSSGDGTLRVGAGTANAPSIAFTADADGTGTGMFRADVNSIGFSQNGVKTMSLDQTGFMLVNTGFRIGAAQTIGWSSTADPAGAVSDTGLARAAAGVVKVTDGSTGSGKLYVADGTRALPSLSFTSEPDSGWYVVGAGEVGFSVNDTLAYSFAQTGAGQRWYVSNAERMRLNGTVFFNLDPSYQVTWGTALGSADIGLTRAAAGIVKVTNGSTGDGIVRAGDGDPTTPAYSFTSSTGTGMYRAATNRLRFATGGAMRLEIDGNGNVFPASIGQQLFGFSSYLASYTSDHTMVAAEAMGFINNTGAGGTVNITLIDNPTGGTWFEFACTAAQTFNIKPAAGESIQDAGSNGTTQIQCSAIGATIKLMATSTGSGAKWFVMYKNGTWTLS